MQNERIYRFNAENGLLIHMRPMQPADAPCLIDLFKHMGPESRYRRFNVSLDDPDPDTVDREASLLATIDPTQGEGWLAMADLPDQGSACVGGVRWIRTPASPDVAEVSLAVRDDLQGLGIGTCLLIFIGHRAYDRGVRTLVGVIQSTNVPLWRTLQHLNLPLELVRDGSFSYVELDLEESLARCPDIGMWESDLGEIEQPGTPSAIESEE